MNTVYIERSLNALCREKNVKTETELLRHLLKMKSNLYSREKVRNSIQCYIYNRK